MKRMTFIYCTSLILFAWLQLSAASTIPPLAGMMIRSENDPSLCIEQYQFQSLTVATCDPTSLSQRFNHSTTGNRLMSGYGQCVTVSTGNRAIALTTCTSLSYNNNLQSFQIESSPGSIRPSMDTTQCFTVYLTKDTPILFLAPCLDNTGGTQRFFSTFHDSRGRLMDVTNGNKVTGYNFDSYANDNPTVTLMQGDTYYLNIQETSLLFYLFDGNGQALSSKDGVQGNDGITSGVITYSPPVTNASYSVHYGSASTVFYGDIIVIPPEPSFVNGCAINNGGCGTSLCHLQIWDGLTTAVCGCTAGTVLQNGFCVPASSPLYCVPMNGVTGGQYYCPYNTYSTIVPGTVCQLSCNIGYKKVGYDAFCNGNGYWQGYGSCYNAGCATAPSSPSGGYYSCGTMQPGQTCTLYCYSGYTKTGSDPVCGYYGSYTGPFPTCTLTQATCYYEPTAPTGGYYSCSDVPSGGTCPLYCYSGYTKSGNDPVCSGGSFSAPFPTCILDSTSCGTQPASPSNGYYNCGVQPNGGTCQLYCYSGYSKSGDDPVCTYGVYYNTPTCLQECYYPPSSPTNGYIYCAQPTPSGQQCTITCDTGYQLVGSAPVCNSGSFTYSYYYCQYIDSTGPSSIIDTGSSSSDSSIMGMPVWLVVGVACFSVMCLVFCFLLCQSAIIRRRKRNQRILEAEGGYAALNADGEMLEGRPVNGVPQDGAEHAVDDLSLRYLGCTPEGVINVNASRNNNSNNGGEGVVVGSPYRYGERDGVRVGEDQKAVAPWDEDLLRLPLLQQQEFWRQQELQRQQQLQWQQQQRSSSSVVVSSGAPEQGETGVDDESLYIANVYPLTTLPMSSHPVHHLSFGNNEASASVTTLPQIVSVSHPLQLSSEVSSPSLSQHHAEPQPQPLPSDASLSLSRDALPFTGYQSVEHLHLFAPRMHGDQDVKDNEFEPEEEEEDKLDEADLSQIDEAAMNVVPTECESVPILQPAVEEQPAVPDIAAVNSVVADQEPLDGLAVPVVSADSAPL